MTKRKKEQPTACRNHRMDLIDTWTWSGDTGHGPGSGYTEHWRGHVYRCPTCGQGRTSEYAEFLGRTSADD